MKKLIVVADWATDYLSKQEFRSSVEGFLKSNITPNIQFVASSPSTIHTGFLTNQVVWTEERLGIPTETVIFINTDPRLSKETAGIAREGAELLISKLKSGIYVAGPNSDFCYTFIKSRIDVLFKYDISEDQNQFRSRDLYSRLLAHLMDYLEAKLELEETVLSKIPELDGYFIGHIDNFGNIKTTFTHSNLKGKYEIYESLQITINAVTRQVKYAKNLFSGSVGELIIYPGSSGDPSDPYLEISAWSHFGQGDKLEKTPTGIDFFNNPKPGDKVILL